MNRGAAAVLLMCHSLVNVLFLALIIIYADQRWGFAIIPVLALIIFSGSWIYYMNDRLGAGAA